MASMTGKFPGGCCGNIRHYADRIECTPWLGEGTRKSHMSNCHHEWRAKVWGDGGETVHIVLHWPEYDPALVDKTACTYWFVESFAGVVTQTVFVGEDELHWTRLEGVRRDGWDFYMDVTLPESGMLYVSVNLPFTVKALETVCREFADYRIPLGKTAGGLDLPCFRFGTGKKVLWLQANQHVTEVCGCYVLWSLMRYLVKPETELGDYSFFIIPSVSVEKLYGDMEYPETQEDINRDWSTFHQPETQAISGMLAALKAEGYSIELMADLHNGWCRPEDSGGNITEYNHGFVDNEYWERRMRFTNAMLASMDYEKPDKIWWHDRPLPKTFMSFGTETYHTLSYTWEFSRFQLWDRAKGDYVPLTPEGLMKLGEQLGEFLLGYEY